MRARECYQHFTNPMNYVISLGGSIINPGQIQVSFLRRFRRLVLNLSSRGNNFYIVTGGGKVTRDYQAAAKQIAKISNEDLDWLGIAPTKVNAELVRSIFGVSAYESVISDPREKVKTSRRIQVFSGWKPGHSTDYDAVCIAQTHGAKTVINLSNVDYVYTADPRKDRRARKITKMTWAEFRKIFGAKWKPGAHVPFDPVAAELAQKLGVSVFIANGRNLKNLDAILKNRPFKGTVIS